MKTAREERRKRGKKGNKSWKRCLGRGNIANIFFFEKITLAKSLKTAEVKILQVEKVGPAKLQRIEKAARQERGQKGAKRKKQYLTKGARAK